MHTTRCSLIEALNLDSQVFLPTDIFLFNTSTSRVENAHMQLRKLTNPHSYQSDNINMQGDCRVSKEKGRNEVGSALPKYTGFLSSPCLTFMYTLPFLPSTWLSPPTFSYFFQPASLSSFYFVTFSSFHPRNREFAISP